jgi:hypothetical protein
MAQQKSPWEKWEEIYEKEKQLTKEALADVQQYLSHDTSTTRKQLAIVLKERAEVIESELMVDNMAKDLSKIISDDPVNEGSIAEL